MPLYYLSFLAWEMDIQLCVLHSLSSFCLNTRWHQEIVGVVKKIIVSWTLGGLRPIWGKPDSIDYLLLQRRIIRCPMIQATNSRRWDSVSELLLRRKELSSWRDLLHFSVWNQNFYDLQWTKSGTTVKKQQCQMIWAGMGWGAESQGRIPMPCNSSTSFSFLWKLRSTYLELPKFGWFYNP